MYVFRDNGIWAKTTSRCFMKLALGGCQLRVSSLQPPLQNTRPPNPWDKLGWNSY